MIHWTWIVFAAIVILIIVGMASMKDDRFGIGGMLLLFLLIAFVLIWGGIFWW